MTDILYKYPTFLCIGDLIVDRKTKQQCMVRDCSIYSVMRNGELYRRVNWIQIDSAIYSPDAIYKKYRSNEKKQLEVVGSVLFK